MKLSFSHIRDTIACSSGLQNPVNYYKFTEFVMPFGMQRWYPLHQAEACGNQIKIWLRALRNKVPCGIKNENPADQ